jgi:hypothetical protein
MHAKPRKSVNPYLTVCATAFSTALGAASDIGNAKGRGLCPDRKKQNFRTRF